MTYDQREALLEAKLNEANCSQQSDREALFREIRHYFATQYKVPDHLDHYHLNMILILLKGKL